MLTSYVYGPKLEAFDQFLLFWSKGLQPSLSLMTNSDGSICVKSEVVSLPPPSISIVRQASTVPEQGCKRSGRKSRLRRKSQRAKNFQKESFNHTEVLVVNENEIEDAADESLMDFETHAEDQTTSFEEHQCVETDQMNILEFGDGISAILADLKGSLSRPVVSTSTEIAVVPDEEEDFSNIPIDQLSKSQFAKFMEEVKTILTFKPSDFRLIESDVQPPQ